MDQIIAIDPDVEKNGVCIISDNRVELFVFNFSTLIFTFFKNIKTQKDTNPALKVKLFVEAGYLNRTFFQPINGNSLIIGRINRNIGENHATAKQIIACADYYGLEPIPTLPVRSTNYKSRGKKITHEQFIDMLKRNNLFCSASVTNQDVRDAALIAVTYGINNEHSIKDIAVEKKIPQFMQTTL
ncbi:MAG: hypothetical protein KBT36_14980 [Kurthia sp.]|nr:hypothetical protein [Candidatus Kurthia equi]